MAQKEYWVDGRQFRTESDYSRALHDKKIIDSLRAQCVSGDKAVLTKIYQDVKNGGYHFYTILGEDYREELELALRNAPEKNKRQRNTGIGKKAEAGKKAGTGEESASVKMDEIVRKELVRIERRRKLTRAALAVLGVVCLGYFGLYSWFNYRTENNYEELNELKNKPVITQHNGEQNGQPEEQTGPQFTLDSEVTETPEVLEEYKNLLIVNKRLIGWVKIDDTNIDYPVVQTEDNEYYLTHNLNQQYDKNGTIFLDKDCSVLKPSTNLIIYGHHMQSGRMFGNLDYYQDEEYYKKHPLIQFDTIYEKGTWQIMYVFRSKVYSEDVITFKYYQFIDAGSEKEFDSYMKEMADMSLYDTGVTAEYGDRLLTLSTCDYREANGRFVVVAKRIKE